MYKFAKSIIKNNGKMLKLKTYNKIINNLIYLNKWYKAVNKEL